MASVNFSGYDRHKIQAKISLDKLKSGQLSLTTSVGMDMSEKQ